jgi:molybdate transport system substrate-binding protein
MEKKLLLTAALAAFILLGGCSQNTEQTSKSIELTISAAASLSQALMEIENIFEKQNPDINLHLNFGSSGSLQQQIIQGAPVDLFFSAAKTPFYRLVKENLILPAYSTDLIGNELALIVPKQSKVPLGNFRALDSGQIARVAIGIPETVPAGQYSMQVLKGLNIDQKIAEKLIPAKDVRQVLSYVETNNTDAGIVYVTDAKGSDKVKVISLADPALHDPIVYPVGVLKSTPNKKQAIEFYEFLKTKAALQIFKNYGFKILD